MNPDHIVVEFKSVGGFDRIKEASYELVILPLKRPELFAYGKLLDPQKGVLLVSNLMSKWFGDARKLGKQNGISFKIIALFGQFPGAVMSYGQRGDSCIRAIYINRMVFKFKMLFLLRLHVLRKKILKVILKNERVVDTIDFDHIARLCEGSANKQHIFLSGSLE
ncbi:uncharacterized protein LOC111302704 [Durio zibethinus]|uniref:Uncharacterized protein LOC111302704 n=1 Tax=Durio zibethinus TaxID=66656 RepID=A0A6P5ZNV2_DURZI|nr:uncharacterized protein LOC111302704 [Durio zibethinus]